MENDRRLELYELNSKVWMDICVFPLKSSKLDSSIKRNTGFIKKLKLGITKDILPSLLKDLSEVLLSKYLSEIIITANEALSNLSNKNDDIAAAVEVISGLHQRFSSQFTEKLFELFLHNFTNPIADLDNEKEELVRIDKINCNLRIFTELFLVGIFSLKEDSISRDNFPPYLCKKNAKKDAILFTILKEILDYKFRMGYTTIISTSFVKKFPVFFKNDDKSWDTLINDGDLKKSIQMLFKIFVDAVFARTVAINKKLRELTKEHQKCQIRTGKVRDEYIDEHDELLPIFERFNTASIALAAFFDKSPPILETEKLESAKGSTPMITNQVIQSNQIFENEETRRFYEALPDMTETFEKCKSFNNNEPPVEAVNAFVEKIEMVETKDALDELCHEYWLSNIDNKATRKRLLKFFIETQDWSKLKLYARFIAANKDQMPYLTTELVDYLDNGFRNQLHSDRINFKNIIFFSQFVKFGLIPKFMVFHKIRTLIMNMQVPNNVEILTVLFENLAKYLINHPEHREEMEKMVNLIKEKCRDRQININLKGAIDNLFTLVYPPSVKSLNIEKREYSDEENFYITLIRRELLNVSIKLVSKLIKRANWKDPCVYETLFMLFTEPNKIHFQAIPALSKVLAELYGHHKNFVVQCVDQILEKIDIGLDTNRYEDNVSRVSSIKYLTEMYNVSIIKYEVLQETLYSIIKFGYPNGIPNPFIINNIDLKDNYFRIQLVTTSLLSITRVTVELEKSIPRLLRFLEYYSFCKDQPVPVETEFKLSNVYNSSLVKATFERSTSFEECYAKIITIIQTENSNTNKRTPVEPVSETNIGSESEEESEADSEEEELDEEYAAILGNGNDEINSLNDDEEEDVDDDDDEENDDDDNSNSSSSEDSNESSYSDSESDNDDYTDIEADRNIEKRRIYEEYQKKLKGEDETKVELEMEKQFQLMMQESMDSRKNERVATSNIPIITNRGNFAKPKLLSKSNDQSNQQNKVAFSFLTKSGKKTRSRTLVLPTDVKFVSDVLENEERLKNEREKIKNIVLQRTFD